MARIYTWYVVTQSNTPSASGGGDWRYYYDIESTQDAPNNRSLVTVDCYIQIKAPFGSTVPRDVYSRAIIDGTTLTRIDNKNLGTSVDKVIYLGQLSRYVTHNTDGTKSIYVKCGGKIPTTFQDYYEETDNTLIVLPTIPKQSVFTAPATNFSYTIGNTLTVNATKYSASYTDTLVVKVGGTTIKTITPFTSQTITFSAGEITAMYNATPNSNSASMTLELTTKSGSTTIGSSTRSGTAFVTNANPIFTNYTTEDTSSAMIALTGSNQKYVSGYSDLRFTITSANKAVAQKGATMVNYIVKCGSKQTTVAYSSSATVTGNLTDIVSGTAEVFAVDSRGNQTLVSKALNLITYNKVIINSLNFSRTNFVGEETTLVAAGTWTNVNFGSVTNSLFCDYEYKETSSSTWITGTTSLTITPSGNNWSINKTIVGDVAGGFNPEKSYDVRLTVYDKIAGYQLAGEVSKGTPILHVHPSGVGVNKVRENGALDVNGDIYSNGFNISPSIHSISKNSGGSAWWKIAEITLDSSSSNFSIKGYSQIANFSERGHWELILSFASSADNNIDRVDLITKTQGINKSRFDIRRDGTNTNKIKIYFNITQFTQYNIFIQRVRGGSSYTLTTFDVAETPSGTALTILDGYNGQQIWLGKTTNQAVTANIGTTVLWQTEVLNTCPELFTFNSSTHDITIKRPVKALFIEGRLRFTAQVTTEIFYLYIQRNGVNEAVRTATYDFGTDFTTMLANPNVNDTIRLSVFFTTTGRTLNGSSAHAWDYFKITAID